MFFGWVFFFTRIIPKPCDYFLLLIDFSLNVKAAPLIFMSGRGSTISSAKEGKSG